MDEQDIQTFIETLNEMGEVFCDRLSEVRQRSYWRLLRDLCTLDEWRYACTQALLRETFHKVPVPAQLLDYVREYRRAQRELRESPRGADGVHTRAELLALREPLAAPDEIAALIASVWPEERKG